MKLAGLIAILLLSGCGLFKPTIVSQERSSVTTERVVPRDTTIIVPASNVKLEALLEELIKKQSLTKENGNAKVVVSYRPEDKSLVVEGQCKELEYKAQLFDKIIQQIIEKQTTVEKPKPFMEQLKDSVLLIVLLAVALIVGLLIRR